MRRVYAYLLALLLCLACPFAGAAERQLHGFDKDSFAAMQVRYTGQPFVLVLWSLSCHFCVADLSAWGTLQKQYPTVPIVLVNADSPSEQAAVPRLIKQKKLDKLQHWAFADAYAEPIRWSIDPQWRGELPRMYLFDSSHKAQALSGMLNRKNVEAWLAKESHAYSLGSPK